MLVKLVEKCGWINDYDCHYEFESTKELPWDDITQEEFKILEEWVKIQNRENGDSKFILLRFSEKPIPEVLADYVRIAQRDLKTREEKELRAKQKKENDLKVKEEKKRAEDLRLLNELKSKYGEYGG